MTHLAFFAGEEIVKDETRRLQAPCSHLPAWKHLQWDVQEKKLTVKNEIAVC